MAQAICRDIVVDTGDFREAMKKKENPINDGSFRFNAAAPEFVPRTAADQVPATGYFYPCFQYLDGTSGSWIYVADQETVMPLVQPKPSSKLAQAQLQAQQQNNNTTNPPKETPLSNELKQKIIKQVVSGDGKKVKRKHPFTDKEKEDLQLRTVIAENLPDDHSHQNIEKLFNVVGSIKAIRICQPQEQSNTSRSSKGDLVVSNKLHALVEYENPETAERAAEKLNDERNWRKGIRVRVMLKRSPKSVLKSRKSDFDGCLDDEGPPHHLHEDASEDDETIASKKSWSRNRSKSKHRPLQTARSLPASSSHLIGSCPGEILARVTAKGPRMPDGTRGFTMGRGKPLTVPVQSS